MLVPPKLVRKTSLWPLFTSLKRTVETQKMGSKLNYLVRDPILLMGCPWRATADLVCGRVCKVYRWVENLSNKYMQRKMLHRINK